MTRLGINIPWDGRVPVAHIVVMGAAWVRLELRFPFDLTEYFRALKRAGIRIMLVGGSHPDSLTDDESLWADRIAQADARYGALVDIWVHGNEWEAIPPAPSSWIMSPDRLNRLNTIASQIQPLSSRTRWLAGCCSGQPGRLLDIDLSLVSGVCFHPYAKEAGSSQLDGLIRGYAGYGLDIGASEFDANSPGMAACLAADTRLLFALAFCYDQAMVPEFGMIDLDGNPLPSYRDFVAAASGPVSQPVVAGGEVDMTDFQRGFKDLADQLGADVVGTPLEDEHSAVIFGHDGVHQSTDKGDMIWLGSELNATRFLPGQQPGLAQQ